METEVASTLNEASNNLKNNINILQSTNKEPISKENIELKKNDSSESFSITNKKSGASPKLLKQNNSTNSYENSGSDCVKDSTVSECHYFFEDEIYHVDKRGRVKYGLVLDTSGIYSGDEDDEFDEILDKGEIRTAWYPDFKETVQSENSIGLVDRSLIPGDVVRKNETQIGYCRDINMKADVKILGTKYVIKNVNAERLKVISNWQQGGAVCLDSWVGSIKDVEEKAVLRTDSGCLIEISSKDFLNFQDLNVSRQHDVYITNVFYPNNTVRGILPPLKNIKILTPNIPLHSDKKGKNVTRKFTVDSIYTNYVWVDWQYKALSDETNFENITLQPNPCIKGDDLNRLKRLNLLESCMLQIVDRNYLTYSSCDTLIEKSNWHKEQSVKFREIWRQQKEGNQKHFARTPFISATGTSGTLHHGDKYKKKISLSSDDKSSNKLKRNSLKADKLAKRETSQVMVSQEKLAQKSDSYFEEEWFSTEEEDEAVPDKNNSDVIAMDIDSFVDNLKQYSEDCISSTTTMSTCSSSSIYTRPKRFTKSSYKKSSRNLKKTLLTEDSAKFKPKEGDEIVTETLLVYSTVTVVWQDGIIESDIPSTQLYPVHHLDNHEFFPGDFVISAKENPDFSNRDYGVIQTVDHDGRIAHVKWFSTYTSADEPKPAYKGESECSVYDLKDQPDFPYRPGSIVIRVGNFVGEDAKCTAGQVIDNCIDGRVKVWWVDGHISLCWPQDLFEVAQLETGDLIHTSEDSWETESENSEFGGSTLKLPRVESDIVTNIHKAYSSLNRLEEIFNINPNLQNPEVMRKLLVIYKSCRFLDRLSNTNHFHEEHFAGLIERVRKEGTQSMHEHVQEQKDHLFSDNLPHHLNLKKQHHNHHEPYSAMLLGIASVGGRNICFGNNAVTDMNTCHQSLSKPLNEVSLENLNTTLKDFSPRVLFKIMPYKCANSSSNYLSVSPLSKKSNFSIPEVTASKEFKTESMDNRPTVSAANIEKNRNKNLPSTARNIEPQIDISPNQSKQYTAEKNHLLKSVMINIEKAFEKTTFLSTISQDNSENKGVSSSKLTNTEPNNFVKKSIDQQQPIHQSNSIIELVEVVPEMVCLSLCSLLKEQLLKLLNDICEKYNKDEHNLNGVLNVDFKNNKNKDIESIIDADGNELLKNECKNDSDMNGMEMEITSSLIKSEAEASSLSANIAEEASPNILNVNQECFQVLPTAPQNHKYQLNIFHPNNSQQYYKAVQREHRLLKTSLPPGIHVRVYEDRMDLLSVMIHGPKYTPYEGGMFFFDIQLGRDYPKTPPLCHYISYCSDRLNPNLYENGKVCVSLLGTWVGKNTEVWGSDSTLLQLIVSIQGLILVAEPYFNEAGYEKQKGTQHSEENSRMYNEMVIIKLIQATTKLLQNPPGIFRHEINNYFKQHGLKTYERVKGWMELSKLTYSNTKEPLKHNTEAIENLELQYSLPDFPLVPASRGFCLTLTDILENFKHRIISLNDSSTTPETSSATEPTTACE